MQGVIGEKQMKKILLVSLSLIFLVTCLMGCSQPSSGSYTPVEENDYTAPETTYEDTEVEETQPTEPSSSNGYTGAFDIVGMWGTTDGQIISFGGNGQVSPTLFGFDGGPNGSWAISSKRDANGCFTLQASHITGGEITYKVTTLSPDQIELDVEGESYFSATHYSLERQ
jgi:hypothetical protein